jgi:hypothetical protein
MIFIYLGELQEEAPMDKEHQKRGKKTYTRNTTLIYTTTYRKFKEEKLLEKETRSMKIGGAHEVREIFLREGISIGGVIVLPMMSKGIKRNIRSMKIGGANPREDAIFH